MTAVDNAGTRLVAALTAAGFTTAGTGRGYVRMGWPGSDGLRGSLVVPTDDTAPEYVELLKAVGAQLLDVERRGQAARRAINHYHLEKP